MRKPTFHKYLNENGYVYSLKFDELNENWKQTSSVKTKETCRPQDTLRKAGLMNT